LPEETPVYLVEQAVLDTVAGFHLHRGVLAIGRKPDPMSARRCCPRWRAGRVVLVLCGIANHDNMGGIFRNAAAFGVDGVILDSDCCDPLYRKAIRVSVGATLSVPTAWLARDEDIASLLERHGFEALALSPLGHRDPGQTEAARTHGGAAGRGRARVVGGARGPRPRRSASRWPMASTR
jgi:tRNA G18 (ribose-2'-O)-methylase SpoU